MQIEVLVRWTELKAVKSEQDQDEYIKRLTDPNYEPENQTIQATVHYDYSPIVMDTDDILRYNRSNDPDFTTIRTKDGEVYVIAYPYGEFMEFMIEATGKTVTSLVPETLDKLPNAPTRKGGGEIDFEEDSDNEDDLIL